MAVLIGHSKISKADLDAWNKMIDEKLAIIYKKSEEEYAKLTPEELEKRKKAAQYIGEKMQDQGW